MSRRLGPKRRTGAKEGPYESGIAPRYQTAARFDVRFYLVAMIFIIFDIEVIFLYPWAVVYHQLWTFGLAEMAVFAVVVFVAFAYLVSNGALDWGPKRRTGGRPPADLCAHHLGDGGAGPSPPGAVRGRRAPPARRRDAGGRRAGASARDHALRTMAGDTWPGDRLNAFAPNPVGTSAPDRPTVQNPNRAKARRKTSMGLEDLQHNFLTGTLEGMVKWARASSSWAANFGLACCAMEMMAAGAANFDLARFGMEVFRASPRQADVMIVAGRVSQKMAPVLRQVYDQMVEPKWVISMGVCASTGGMFNNYAIVQGVDQIVPVDVYAPGCPPGPETLIHAILTLHQKIRVGEITRRTATGTGAGIHLEPSHRVSRCGCRLNERPRPRQHLRSGQRSRPASGARRRLPPSLHGCPLDPRAKAVVVHCNRGDYLPLMTALKEDGYELPVGVTGVDYLTHPGRDLPRGIKPERFEVVVELLSLQQRQRVRVRCQVPAGDPGVPTCSTCGPGPRPTSGRPTTCSGSASTAIPIRRGS